MSMEEAKEFLAERFGTEAAAGLADAGWKARMTAMDTVLEALPAMDAAAHGAACLQALGLCPGWKDSNFQVRAPALLETSLWCKTARPTPWSGYYA